MKNIHIQVSDVNVFDENGLTDTKFINIVNSDRPNCGIQLACIQKECHAWILVCWCGQQLEDVDFGLPTYLEDEYDDPDILVDAIIDYAFNQ